VVSFVAPNVINEYWQVALDLARREAVVIAETAALERHETTTALEAAQADAAGLNQKLLEHSSELEAGTARLAEADARLLSANQDAFSANEKLQEGRQELTAALDVARADTAAAVAMAEAVRSESAGFKSNLAEATSSLHEATEGWREGAARMGDDLQEAESARGEAVEALQEVQPHIETLIIHQLGSRKFTTQNDLY